MSRRGVRPSRFQRTKFVASMAARLDGDDDDDDGRPSGTRLDDIEMGQEKNRLRPVAHGLDTREAATRLFFRSLSTIAWTSLSEKPAARNLRANAHCSATPSSSS